MRNLKLGLLYFFFTNFVVSLWVELLSKDSMCSKFTWVLIFCYGMFGYAKWIAKVHNECS